MSDEIKALVAKLTAKQFTGRRTLGGGTISHDGTSTMWGNEPIMELRNPDGPEAAAALTAQADEIERLRVALDTASIRLAHLAGQIEAGFNISGTLRADQAMKARHMADEARAALKAAQEVKTIESAEHLKEGR